MSKQPPSFCDMSPKTVLKQVFGYSEFRPLQEQIIQNVLQKQDTLAIMPTGGGKSLCYQIPALMFCGLTLVISPLISLMQDQVFALVANGVEAVFLNSSQDIKQRQECMQKIQTGKAKLLYLSPEGLFTNATKEFLANCNLQVDCITIDEAHCISQWGHDFRPDYLAIAKLRDIFKDAVFLALTATATQQVKKDILFNLNMQNAKVFVSSFNRKNIYLDVCPKIDAFSQTLQCIQKHPQQSGIIYCYSRKQVDTLTQKLLSKCISATSYHAGLAVETRKENQDLFVKGKVNVIVATVAFGMGINVPNVRYVIHYDLPKSIEDYYQQIGRAGRDGLPSYALLLYTAADAQKIRYFFKEKTKSEMIQAQNLLQSMLNFAKRNACRRKLLLSYFGENIQPGNYGEPCCDICTKQKMGIATTLKDDDVTILFQKLLSCIIKTGYHFGKTYLIDVLLGSRQERIKENAHDSLSVFGIGKEITKRQWQMLVTSLIEAGFLYQEGDYRILKITQKGIEALNKRQKVLLPIGFSKGFPPNSFDTNTRHIKQQSFVLHKKVALPLLQENDTMGHKIADALKLWRRNTADAQNVPPYVIFGDRTLLEIAQKKPKTMQQLLFIYGIGGLKAQKFGTAILQVIKDVKVCASGS